MATATKKFFLRPAKRPKNEDYGKKVEIKNFYENPLRDETDGAPAWVEWAPPSIAQRKNLKWDGYAMHIYRKLNKSDAVDALEKFAVSHITILSPYIRDTLKEARVKYDSAYYGTSSVTIHWPFSQLYFARDRIAEHAKTSDDAICRDHLELLIKVMEDELGEIMSELEELDAANQITHALVWALFPPGSIVLSEIDGVMNAFRVVDASFSGSSFVITGRYVRFDGTRYGYRTQTLTIRYFSGKKPVSSLEVYPIEAAANYEDLKDRLSERGRRVLDFQHIHYMRYLNKDIEATQGTSNFSGTADMWGDNIHSRVIVDFVHYSRRVHRTEIESLPGYSTSKLYGNDAKFQRSLEPGRSRRGDDEDKNEVSKVGRLNEDEQKRNREIVLEDSDNLLLMDPFLDGFSFVSKDWCRLNVEKISPLELNSDAFDHLVFSERSKELVCALVEDHKTNAKLQDDLVAGKGQGLLILLSGPPGTGKTLMAEAVADKTNSPLYYVDTRDLGRNDLDTNLKTIMTDAAEWNAMVLLDEADVYISERSSYMTQNEIVSIFLRRLEYFKGTMFLTTNLMDKIDNAVESRIQVHLRFSNLTETSRSRVWQNFLARIPNSLHEITEDDIQQLRKWNMNGREIKNALKMTAAWCRQTKQKMTLETFNDIISITCPKAKKEDFVTEEARPNGVVVHKEVNGVEPKASHLLEMEDLLN